MVMQNDKMKGEILVIALNRIKMRGTKLVEATTRGKEARQEEDRKGDQEAGPRNGTRGHVQKTPMCIAMIKDSGLVTKTPLRRGGTQWRDPEEGPEAKTSLPEAEPKGGTQGRIQTTPQCIVMINLIPLKDSGLVTEMPCRGGTQRQDSGAGPEAKTPLTEAGPRGGTRGRVQTTPKRTAMINFTSLKDSGLVTKTPFSRGGTQRRVYRHDQFHPPQGRWFGHQNAFPPQRGRGNQRGQRGGGFHQDQIAEYRDNSLYGSQEWRYVDGGNFQPQMGRGSQGGRGRQPNPKSKPKGYGRGGNFQEQHQIQGDFQESDQFPDPKDSSQIMPRQPNQPNERGRNFHEKQKHTVSSRKPVSKITSSPCSVDDSDAGKVADQSQFETNKILIRGLSGKTSRDGLSNFIEARSGGKEVKDVQMLKNGKALVTMADKIKGRYLSIEFGE